MIPPPPKLRSASVALSPETFLINPLHQDYVSGKNKHLKSNSRFMVGCLAVFMSFFLLAGLCLMATTLRDAVEWYLIAQQGIPVRAEYIDRRISTDDDGDTYYVRFQYTVLDRQYTRQQRVTQEIYNRAEVGGGVDVTYVRSDPQIAVVAGTNTAPIPFLAFSLCWNAVVWIPVGFAIKFYRMYRFLERHGRLLQGEILKASHARDSDGDLVLTIEYAFQVPETHQRLTQTTRATRNDLKGRPLPATGWPVAVLYHDPKTFMLM